MSEPELKRAHLEGVEFAYFEWGTQTPDKPTLFFVHATGFHGRLWDFIIHQLPNCHAIAFEQRGHGRSENSSVKHWGTLAQDQVKFLKHLNIQHMIGIGHSMGAHGLIEAAGCTVNEKFLYSLLLLDPTVSAPENYSDEIFEFPGGLHPAAKRRAVFHSTEDMIQQISGKSSFPKFHAKILRDYCEYGLVPTSDGQLTLACPAEVEAWVYMTARTNKAIFDHAGQVTIPTTIVRAKDPQPDNMMDFSSSPTWPGLVNLFANGVEYHWPDCTHFIPMERPNEVVQLIESHIEAWHENRE